MVSYNLQVVGFIFLILVFLSKSAYDRKVFGKSSIKRPVSPGNVGFFMPTRPKSYITIFLLVIFLLLFGTNFSWIDCPFHPCSSMAGGLFLNFQLLTHVDKAAIIFGAFLVSYLISCCISFVLAFFLKETKK